MDFDILIPITFFAACVIIIYMNIQAKLRRAKMDHEERMMAIERGTALPPRIPVKTRNPYKWGYVLIAIGVAMFIAMAAQGDEDFLWGLMPFLIGIGLIYSQQQASREERRLEKKNSATQPTEMPPTEG